MKSLSATIAFSMFFIFSDVSIAHKELQGGKPVQDSSIHQLSTLWIDSEGQQLSLKNFRGRPFLLAMAYTRCESSCPLIVDDLLSIVKSLPSSGQNIKIVLVSFDSDHETPETMKKYREKKKLNSNWTLLKGDSDAVTELAAVLGVKFKKLKNGEYVHSNSIFLVDKEGVIIAQKDRLRSKNLSFTQTIIEQMKVSEKID